MTDEEDEAQWDVQPNRRLHFDEDQMDRIRTCAYSLRTSMAEFIEWATMNACDEIDGITRTEFSRGNVSDTQESWYCGARLVDRS